MTEESGDNGFQHNEEPPHIEIPKIRPMSTGESPRELAKGLEGKYVDEFGNILDWDGTVLGRVEGDLPSMVGRPVEESGEILDADGEVAGHVSENYSRPPLKPLQGGLKVDEEGNIYNDEGQVIGRLNSPPPGSGKSLQQNAHNTQSAHDDPKPSPATPSPSEVYLDIKSTHDGIQLIIKIPTVFNRDPEKRQ
ncbi:hypothetical protein B0I35DRAFT_454344 [Stachybotrys elegans]|uniref:LEA domain protein n=1 Tax=Stachybotrys elegans TaxID=80388 RepID=A0A8K0WKC7_9HYPO|nr:hypothetical protein B0I35DRAFT_454344 [Stachybotrys elegans]